VIADIQQLILLLEEMIPLLRSYNMTHWPGWLESGLRSLRDGDPDGADHLLMAYGGMGSFNDLIICPENGHDIDRDAIEPVNRRLDELRAKSYVLARRISRDVNRGR
jgi:hypothetical protein